jgi:hypothetical protein
MMNFSHLLVEKSDTIVERWIEAIRQDAQIGKVNELPFSAIRDHIPRVLTAMATILSQSHANDVQALVEASLEHGVLRAEQGFDPTAIAREYRLLRQEIFSALESELVKSPSTELLRAVRLIDIVVDEATAQCFKSYVDERLRELEQLQSQLTLTNQELTRLVRVGQDNLSQLAHELKTPLNSIIGYSELVLRQQRRPDVRDTSPSLENVERVLRNGRQLLRLINDTLEISRYEAGKMQLRLKAVDIRSVLTNVIEVMEPMAASKQLQIMLECDRAPNQVKTDALRLQQIVTNLLSNAIRYTEAGSIHLRCETLSEQQWSIVVSDTGVGIPVEDQARIFDPYFRAASNTPSSVASSTGLGLAIVARLVKLLQGKIELVSQVGVGSTFTVFLPLEIQATEEAGVEIQAAETRAMSVESQ